MGNEFYEEVVNSLVKNNVVDVNSSILVVCGGDLDCEVFKKLDFTNVTISNLDIRMKEGGDERYEPYDWSFEDAERLSFGAESFDICVVHSGLHHCRIPQVALMEMYRVSRRGVLAFEPVDSFASRLGVKLGAGQDYEHGAVEANGLKYGGVENTEIPNFVYRFNKKIVSSTFACAVPESKPSIRFWYATRLPPRVKRLKNPVWKIVFGVGGGIFELAGRYLPFLSNNIAFFVNKKSIGEDLFPWLKVVDGKVAPDEEWFEKNYN